MIKQIPRGQGCPTPYNFQLECFRPVAFGGNELRVDLYDARLVVLVESVGVNVLVDAPGDFGTGTPEPAGEIDASDGGGDLRLKLAGSLRLALELLLGHDGLGEDKMRVEAVKRRWYALVVRVVKRCCRSAGDSLGLVDYLPTAGG